MKKIGSAILSCVLCFAVLSFSQAQSVTTIVAPTATVPPSTIYKADIKVAHFKNIVGVQFTMNWDSAVLRFREVKNLAFPPNSQVENFGVTKTANGMLAFQWHDEDFEGRSLNDSTTLFSVEFDVIGIPNSISPLSFTDDLAFREVADSSFNAIAAKYQDGTVQIAETTGTHAYNSAPHLVQVEDSYPNPFHDYTQVQVELKAATQVRLMIQDVQGKTIYEEQRFFIEWQTYFEIDERDVSGSGSLSILINST